VCVHRLLCTLLSLSLLSLLMLMFFLLLSAGSRASSVPDRPHSAAALSLMRAMRSKVGAPSREVPSPALLLRRQCSFVACVRACVRAQTACLQLYMNVTAQAAYLFQVRCKF
jgi:hypothetical protein